DYGAFVELEEGVEGLIHVSEMSWTKKVRPSKLLNMGDEVEAVVTDVNVPNRRSSLSLKALEQNPWDTIAQRYPVGTVINGRVRQDHRLRPLPPRGRRRGGARARLRDPARQQAEARQALPHRRAGAGPDHQDRLERQEDRPVDARRPAADGRGARPGGRPRRPRR